MALGSSRGDVLKLMLGQGLKLAGMGVAIGLALAYLLTRFLASLLFSVKAGDPWTLAAVAAILFAGRPDRDLHSRRPRRRHRSGPGAALSVSV